MIQSHLYLILQVKIQIYINTLHICVYTWLMIYQVASLVLIVGFVLVMFARSKFMGTFGLISEISGGCWVLGQQ